MISLDFSLALAIYLSAFAGVFFFVWFFGKKDKDKELSLDERFIWFCSVCTYTYIDTKQEVISSCPRCGSFNKKSIKTN